MSNETGIRQGPPQRYVNDTIEGSAIVTPTGQVGLKLYAQNAAQSLGAGLQANAIFTSIVGPTLSSGGTEYNVLEAGTFLIEVTRYIAAVAPATGWNGTTELRVDGAPVRLVTDWAESTSGASQVITHALTLQPDNLVTVFIQNPGSIAVEQLNNTTLKVTRLI